MPSRLLGCAFVKKMMRRQDRTCLRRNLKLFLECCVSMPIRTRLITLKLLSKVGVFTLALLLVALPVAACVLPGAGMTAAEQDCCKKMAERCGHAGMAKSHPCCQMSAAPSNLHALKTSATQIGDFSFAVLHSLPISAQCIAALTASSAVFQISDVHGPPGLESLSSTILRI